MKYRLFPFLLATLMASGCIVGDDDPSFHSVVPGDWALSDGGAVGLGSCTQDFVGGPGDLIVMLEEDRYNAAAFPFAARVSIIDEQAVSHSVDVICETEGRQPPDYDPEASTDLVCEGVSDLGFQPDAGVDAAWPVAVRVHGTFTQMAPCTINPSERVWDYTAFDGVWSLSLTGECTGTACEGRELPTDGNGDALCIQSHEIQGTWSGCGAGDDACRSANDAYPEHGCD